MIRQGFSNYKSISDNFEDASIEIGWLLGEKFCIAWSESEVLDYFADGSIVKLAIIIKVKADNTKKRCIIVDLWRSGSNGVLVLP